MYLELAKIHCKSRSARVAFVFLSLIACQQSVCIPYKVGGRIGHTKKCASQRSLKTTFNVSFTRVKRIFYAERAKEEQTKPDEAYKV